MGSALEPADGLASDTGRSSGLRPSAPTFVPGKGLKGLPALSTSRRDSPRSPWRRKFEVPFTPSQGICTPQSSMSIYSNGPGWPQMSQVPFDPYRGYFYPTYMVQSAQPDFHQWSPFVGHMPMTPGTFNAIQRGEFCAPGWSQNCSPSGSGIHVPVTPPTTPSTPVSAQGWKVLRPGLNVHVPPAGPWHEQSPQGAPNEGGPAMGAHGLVHQRSRLGKQVSVGTHLEPIADGAESSTHGDEGPPGNKEMHATAGFKVVASRSHGRRGGQPAVPLNARQRRTLKRAQERAQAAMASFDKTPPAVTK
ncbi:hypothetical protein WJX84_001325 [Apatococcus fuscideae]|uniref:Uncharacterized protein n=1 Tax=Apatococcus fuscideae TaxID=2026836 RepID=A0AAW1T2Z5_9CHLO